MTKLDGLSQKIFLDRYARKAEDASTAKPGDIVLVLMKDDVKFPAKEVGEVTSRSGDKVQVRLRDGELIETTIGNLTLATEHTPDELWDRLAAAMASVEPASAERTEWEARDRKSVV